MRESIYDWIVRWFVRLNTTIAVQHTVIVCWLYLSLCIKPLPIMCNYFRTTCDQSIDVNVDALHIHTENKRQYRFHRSTASNLYAERLHRYISCLVVHDRCRIWTSTIPTTFARRLCRQYSIAYMKVRGDSERTKVRGDSERTHRWHALCVRRGEVIATNKKAYSFTSMRYSVFVKFVGFSYK